MKMARDRGLDIGTALLLFWPVCARPADDLKEPFQWRPALVKGVGPTLMVTLPPLVFGGMGTATQEWGVAAIFGLSVPGFIWDLYRRAEYIRTGEINGGGLGLFRDHATTTARNLKGLAKAVGCRPFFRSLTRRRRF